MSKLQQALDLGYQKITRPMNLGSYHQAYKAITFEVWVNLPRAVRETYADLQRKNRELENVFRMQIKALGSTSDEAEHERLNGEIEALNKDMITLNDEVYAWYAQVWGESPEKVREFAKTLLDQEMIGLWKWMQTETWALITMHLEGLEKN